MLVSGAGTNLQALLEACTDPGYGAVVVAVGADRDGIEGLARAQRAGVPTFVHRLSDHGTREEWDAALTASCRAHDPDLIVLAGFMRLTGSAFLDAFGGRCVNTHPALSPSFPGMHGPADALAYGVRVTGATLFVVDAGVDTGPIVAQTTVPVEDDDDVGTLHERIKVAERAMLVATVGRMAREGFTISDRKVRFGPVTDSTPKNDSTQGTDSIERTGAGDRRPVRRALVSVYDKAGLEELAQGLHAAGVVIVSTGSTAGRIAGAGVPVTEVETLTGFPECLDGRVKTLHPAVHAGILADQRRESHREQIAELGIEAFDLVVSNLYPFVETVSSGATPEECVEQIDIGGPSMVRAAAKNHPSVAILTSPAQYGELLSAVREGGTTLAQRRRLAAEAFVHTATYDVAVASWMGSVLTDTSGGTGFPAWVGATWDRAAVLRYGENPHQRAALYTSGFAAAGGLAQARQLHGKEMSYNNYVDADAARRAAFDFDEPAVAIIKHANPCGIAVGTDVAQAHRKAHACDPVSAFGGVIATNVPVSTGMAEQVAEIFTEVVVAPGFEQGALDVLSRKKNIRLLECGAPARGGVETRPITGGLLMQATDAVDAVVEGGGDDPSAWTLVSGEPATPRRLADLAFAWKACRAVKSNAILLASDGASVGVGMGQVNRVDSCRLAVERAGERAAGSVAASDAFFPFADGPQILVDAGVTAIVQPGGSVRDSDVIDALKRAGVTMYLTGTRHFFH